MKVACALVLALLVAGVAADTYLQYPRSSNNRLNEQSANRDNADRLFDSQNNNRGGYNVGEKTKDTFPQNIAQADQGPDATYDFTDLTTPMQYQQVFFEGSILTVEWTSQHACGGNEQNDPQKINCNILIQYMCNTATQADPAMQVILRDGINTQQPDEPNTITDIPANNAVRGHHESEASYYECKTRSRNYGLFHADQKLNGQTAIYTRQNNNGNRRGLECTEERDYYPYWVPNPWIDVVYLTDDLARCNDYILPRSQNTATTYKCTSAARTDATLKPITEAACTAAGGTWTAYPGKGATPMECRAAEWSRDNHLGNGRNGQMNSYNWTIPLIANIPDAAKYGAKQMAKCVMRLRYNISTDDYNPWAINSSYDDNPQRGIVSPVQENPTVDVGADLQGLRLAINTAQFGRTFQDRTHVFYITPRLAVMGAKRVVNLGVRGKRGNIVQTYPAVEYDYTPNRLHLSATNDLIHLQWTGSNTHNNGNPGGDGQTGDAGEGTGGTDRHNFVQMLNKDDNYPLPLDKFPDNIFAKSTCYDFNGNVVSTVDCALTLATSGQFRTVAQATSTFDPLLNDAPTSLIGGMIMSIGAGEYNYMCTRNNNFSNRSQKGVLIVGV